MTTAVDPAAATVTSANTRAVVNAADIADWTTTVVIFCFISSQKTATTWLLLLLSIFVEGPRDGSRDILASASRVFSRHLLIVVVQPKHVVLCT
jgi:hypothetical protein